MQSKTNETKVTLRQGVENLKYISVDLLKFKDSDYLKVISVVI